MQLKAYFNSYIRAGTPLGNTKKLAGQFAGFYKDRIATVRIDILSDASKQWKNVAISLNQPEFNETISSAPTELVSISNIDNSLDENNTLDSFEPIELSTEEVDDFELYLKVSNFNNYSDIKSIMKSLTNELMYTSEKNGSQYNLIIGPTDKVEINKLVSYFISKGYKETKIILN